MARLMHVEPGGGRRGSPIHHPPKTPIRVNDPDADGAWRAYSTGTAEGRWTYEADATVTFAPTGQTHAFAGLDEARAATAGALLQHLRSEAVRAAYDPDDAERRLAGQRWLAVHMRLAGGTDITSNCLCGGRLTVVHSDGRHGHVDSCPTCQPKSGDTIAAVCMVGTAHRFCADPAPQLSDLDLQILAFEQRWWKRQGAKEAAIREEFDGLSTMRYYRRLNVLLDNPVALAHSPQLVNRLRDLRLSRGGARGSGRQS